MIHPLASSGPHDGDLSLLQVGGWGQRRCGEGLGEHGWSWGGLGPSLHVPGSLGLAAPFGLMFPLSRNNTLKLQWKLGGKRRASVL